MRPIFLIGYMCSGKTTLGRALGRALRREFIDLDQRIETEQGRTIKEIFATDGEQAFRKIEQEMLKKVSVSGSPVVACGGGTPCAAGAMDLMNSLGVTVWLQPAWERLLPRLMHGRRKRPLIANIKTADEMLDFYNNAMSARTPHYSRAMYTFDSSRLEDGAEIEATIREFTSKILGEQ